MNLGNKIGEIVELEPVDAVPAPLEPAMSRETAMAAHPCTRMVALDGDGNETTAHRYSSPAVPQIETVALG